MLLFGICMIKEAYAECKTVWLEICYKEFECRFEWVYDCGDNGSSDDDNGSSDDDNGSDGDDNGSGNGDPHFKMWSGVWFDYQGECDLVMVDNPHLLTGAGVRIHIRTKIQSWYSFIQQAAIQIDTDVLEVQVKNKFYLNGKALERPPPVFAGYLIEMVNSTKWCRKKVCEGAATMRLDLGHDGSITVTVWNGFMYVNVDATGEGFKGSVGLFGKRGIPGKFARNGTILHDDRTYAEEWQVLDTEPALFVKERYPQYPNSCILPPKDQVFRRAMNINQQMAKKACSQVVAGAKGPCMYDVMATGDVDMAIPYE